MDPCEKIYLVQGDNLPYIKLVLRDDAGTALDVSGATVRVHFRAAKTTAVLSTIVCAAPNGGADGVVQFNFPDDTLDVPQGDYEGEVEIDFGGAVQTVYDVLKFYVRAQFA